MKHDDSIEELVDSLTPSRPARSTAALSFVWWITALVVSGAGMLLRQPFRDGVLSQLVTSPRFAIETVLGLLVLALLARAMFELAVPDRRKQRFHASLAIAVTTLWLALFGIAFMSPVLEPSMAGKRPECYVEVVAYGLPLTLIGMALLRRLFVLSPWRTGLIAGVAGGMVPAFLMQLSCMHEPWHIVSHHLAPVLLTGAVGAVLGRLLLRRNSA